MGPSVGIGLPWAVARGVGTAAGVVVGEAGGDIRGVTDVEVWLRIGVLENVDESLVFRHARPEATAMPIAEVSKLTGMCAMGSRRSQFLRLGQREMARIRAAALTDRSCD